MTEPRVVPLTHAAGISSDDVGPKAMGLVRMAQIRLAVPPAFCITARAYLDHLRRNDLLLPLERTLASIEDAGAPGSCEQLAAIRRSIVDAPLSPELCRDIEVSLANLPPAPYAVRSSATFEDLPEHSFAGLHDTVLGVSDLASCLDAVKACWASLWNPGAYEYRRRNGFDHLKGAMAIIVQTLVPADSSGVVFTANPLTGRPASIAIEACLGLGEALVAGKVTPDRFTFDKKSLRLAFSVVAEKSVALQVDEAGCVREIRLDAARSKAPAIDKRTAGRLARLAVRAEKAFGCPQDLEWACHGRRLYFLQSRPITSRPMPLTWEDRQVWTNINLGEVAPDVTTPLTLSFIRPMLYRLFGTLFKILCVDPGEHPFAGVIAGRLYFNVNTGLAVFGHLPGMRLQGLESIFGGAHADLYRSGRLDLALEDIPELNGSLAKMLLRLPLTVYDICTHRPAQARVGLRRFAAWNRRLESLDVADLPTLELIDSLRALFRLVFVDIDLLCLLTSLYALPLVYELTAAWLGDANGAVAARLFTGLGGMADAEAGIALWRLAHAAHKSPGVERAIRAGKDWKVTREEIAALPDGGGFLRAWEDVIRDHGHHCRGELEFCNPRWAETPDYCLDMVRSHIACIGSADPGLHQKRRAKERRRTTRQCLRRLRNPMKRWLFRLLLRQAQNGCILRENYKNEAVRLFASGRAILCELGRRLADGGALSRSDDIFFLECGEIEPLARGDAPPGLRETVRSRRVEYERLCSIAPPKVIIGKFDPEKFTPDPIDASARTLKGIPASPGIATGRARVILRADTEQHLQPGEILVAPFTDPGWTPYFLPAAAIVVDQGGMLSHGSIIAREYGIPAVVNVGPATRVIKTGQNITVDADRGIVTILGEAPSSSPAVR